MSVIYRCDRCGNDKDRYPRLLESTPVGVDMTQMGDDVGPWHLCGACVKDFRTFIHEGGFT